MLIGSVVAGFAQVFSTRIVSGVITSYSTTTSTYYSYSYVTTTSTQFTTTTVWTDWISQVGGSGPYARVTGTWLQVTQTSVWVDYVVTNSKGLLIKEGSLRLEVRYDTGESKTESYYGYAHFSNAHQ
jgi:hypothetical protein